MKDKKTIIKPSFKLSNEQIEKILSETCRTYPKIIDEKSIGLKFDDNKDRWDLLPIKEVGEIVRVLTLGSHKYSDNNWQKTIMQEKGVDRYYAGLMRHLAAWRNGEEKDMETGLHPLSHALCCLLFLRWYENNKKEKK